jgi:hypothetical protein
MRVQLEGQRMILERSAGQAPTNSLNRRDDDSFSEDIAGTPGDDQGDFDQSFDHSGPPTRRIDKLEGYPTVEEFGQHVSPEVAQELWTKLRQHLDHREFTADG